MSDLHPAVRDLLAFFAYLHLPTHLQAVSKPFSDLAHDMALRLNGRMGGGAEATTCLRKLLEAKDCAVRAALCPTAEEYHDDIDGTAAARRHASGGES